MLSLSKNAKFYQETVLITNKQTNKQTNIIGVECKTMITEKQVFLPCGCPQKTIIGKY